MLACQNGHKATIRTLLEGGADVHAKDNVRDQMMTMMITNQMTMITSAMMTTPERMTKMWIVTMLEDVGTVQKGSKLILMISRMTKMKILLLTKVDFSANLLLACSLLKRVKIAVLPIWRLDPRST